MWQPIDMKPPNSFYYPMAILRSNDVADSYGLKYTQDQLATAGLIVSQMTKGNIYTWDRDRKINAIKRFRETTGMGLLEAKCIIEHFISVIECLKAGRLVGMISPL